MKLTPAQFSRLKNVRAYGTHEPSDVETRMLVNLEMRGLIEYDGEKFSYVITEAGRAALAEHLPPKL